MTILVTGAAGFIGANVVRQLREQHQVVGIDNLNDYYNPQLKLDRLSWAGNAIFEKVDISDQEQLNSVFERYKPSRVIHLAAQAGVRYSIENPHAYIQANILGFQNILEACRNHAIEHLVYASSSSVYGNNKKIPFATEDEVDHPVSTYAATKKSNELMAHVYSHLYDLPTTGLRFFTVYGPWGRPDMSPFIFAKAIFSGDELRLFNYGKHSRDFTYISDIVAGIVKVTANPPAPCKASGAPYKIYNIGNNQPVELITYVETLEKIIGKEANKVLIGPQPGDVESTYADIDDLQSDLGYSPATPLEVGLVSFIKWYKDYFKV